VLKRIAVSVLLSAILVQVTACTNPIQDISSPPDPSPVIEETSVSLYDEDLITGIYQKVIPAVVEIHSLSANPLTFSTEVTGQGSGFIFDDQGRIFTNYHVVQGADQLEIIFHNDTKLTATLIGTDRENDIALISVDSNEIVHIDPLVLGDSDSVSPGQMALAFGSPFGLEGSITVGVVSGMAGRYLGTVNVRLQTSFRQMPRSIPAILEDHCLIPKERLSVSILRNRLILTK